MAAYTCTICSIAWKRLKTLLFVCVEAKIYFIHAYEERQRATKYTDYWLWSNTNVCIIEKRCCIKRSGYIEAKRKKPLYIFIRFSVLDNRTAARIRALGSPALDNHMWHEFASNIIGKNAELLLSLFRRESLIRTVVLSLTCYWMRFVSNYVRK